MRLSFARSMPTILAMSIAVGATGFSFGAASASSAYRQINLTSNVPGMAQHTDPNLVNAWGVAFFSGGPFWVSDQVTGLSTLYDSLGNPQSLVVTIPAAPELPGGTIGSPTGIVANPTSAFVVSEKNVSGPGFFLFASLDGTISGWDPNVDTTHAVVAVDNFASHAQYTGLALAKTAHGPRLYAADAVNNRVDAFDPKFRHLFSFTDPNAPKGLSVYAIHLIKGQLVVTFGGPAGAGGAVDVFDFGGRLLKTFTRNGPHGPLDSPWGVAVASPDFGQFSNDILVGNEGNGRINAFDPNTGKFMGQLNDAHGRAIVIPHLWSIEFDHGGGPNGHPNELFFTAGPANYADGLFGKIIATP